MMEVSFEKTYTNDILRSTSIREPSGFSFSNGDIRVDFNIRTNGNPDYSEKEYAQIKHVIRINIDRYKYHHELFGIQDLTKEDVEKISNFINNYQANYLLNNTAKNKQITGVKKL